jgi:O-acetylhomoserine/O-acetylserine sulfhydrylase-like pyridoxal-dependent enzyme
MLSFVTVCAERAVWGRVQLKVNMSPQAVQPLGPVTYAARARVTLLRDIGAALSPFNAF